MRSMRLILTGLLLLTRSALAADTPTVNFTFHDADIVKVIEEYSKASGQKFIIAPEIKGKITILNPGPVTVAEAFNQLSSALAANSLGISTQDDVMNVMHARALQRNFVDVGTELPPLKPERMFTWMIQLKYANADEINKQLRILTSRDGELVPYTGTNSIIVSDWVSNLYRVNKIIKQMDVQAVAAAKTPVRGGDKAKPTHKDQ